MANPNPSESTRFQPGQSGNPGGRPKGKTMKEYAREYLMFQTDEEKQVWLKDLPKQEIWRMAEGNPKNDLEVSGELTSKVISIDE